MRSTSVIGGDLKKLAAEPAYRNLATSLNQLADDLESGDVAPWRKVDLLSLCDAASIEGDSKPSTRKFLAWIDLARNVLLFLPLLFTWAGIFFAVQAYRDLLNAPVDQQAEFAEASFLQMWTRGFGGRTWVTLDVVALLDLVAILAVVTLFVGGAWWQRRAADAEDMERQRHVERLRLLLMAANLALSSETENVVERLVESTKELLPVYEATLHQLLTAEKQLVDYIDEGKQNVAELARATGDFANTSTVIAASAEELKAPVVSLAQVASRLEGAASSLAGRTTDINNYLPAIKQDLLDVLTSVKTLSDELHELYAGQLDDMRAQVSVYQATLKQLLTAQKELASSIDDGRQNVSELVRATGDLARSSDTIAGSSSSLTQHIASLAASTGHFDTAVNSLVTSATDARDGLPSVKQDLLGVLTSIRDLGEKLDNLYARQEIIAQELGVLADNPLAAAQAAKRTAEIAKATQDTLVKTISALPEQMNHLRAAVVEALDREIRERHDAAASLTNSSENVRQAIEAALGRLSSATQDSVDSLQQSIDQLRDSPRHILPDLSEVSAQLASSLNHSRALVDTLVRSAKLNGNSTNGVRRARWRSRLLTDRRDDRDEA